MLNKNFISKVRKFALDNSEEDDIHGFLHTERVLDLCLHIGKNLGANLLILEIAALLHDIGRNNKRIKTSNKNHAELSSEIASKFLDSYNFKISQEDFTNIIHTIRSHSFSNNSNPQTLEAQILSDADKLDALGAIGLYRTIGFTVKNNGNIVDVINHLEEKILKLKDMLYLDLSKKIAEKRHKIILDFYNQIKSDVKVA
ncbi:MAG: HD domain-containing protein [Candidatus Thorarchaeota archaeon]